MDAAARLSDSGLVIFLFHGVAQHCRHEVRNYTGKHLEKDRFYRIVRRLRECGHALSMDEVLEHCLGSRPFPPGSYAITFDDGFENNFSVAAPILKDLGLPATFYVTTSFIENNAMSWIDRIEYCLERAPSGRLRLADGRREYAFDGAGDKIRVLDDLRRWVKSDATVRPDALAGEVFRQCGLDEIQHSEDPLDRKMSWQQVATLARDPDFTVGGHSHHHVILSFLEPADLRREIDTSLRLIAEHTGHDVRHYSYPEGLRHCYSDEVVHLLRAAGVRCCPTAEDGINDHATCPFHLKRTTIAETAGRG